ncbi:hypothetical protein Sjap_006187 [Stephania japonica]|uniref:Uncharacterized protein n=1 Tax=Stephania japonica TaxID=461633 RepID=A0AAP0K731_9MAGN
MCGDMVMWCAWWCGDVDKMAPLQEAPFVLRSRLPLVEVLRIESFNLLSLLFELQRRNCVCVPFIFYFFCCGLVASLLGRSKSSLCIQSLTLIAAKTTTTTKEFFTLRRLKKGGVRLVEPTEQSEFTLEVSDEDDHRVDDDAEGGEEDEAHLTSVAVSSSSDSDIESIEGQAAEAYTLGDDCDGPNFSV